MSAFASASATAPAPVIAIATKGRSPNFPGAFRIAWTFTPLNPEEDEAYSGHGQAVFLAAEALEFCKCIKMLELEETREKKHSAGYITYRAEEAPRYPQMF